MAVDDETKKSATRLVEALEDASFNNCDEAARLGPQATATLQNLEPWTDTNPSILANSFIIKGLGGWDSRSELISRTIKARNEAIIRCRSPRLADASVAGGAAQGFAEGLAQGGQDIAQGFADANKALNELQKNAPLITAALVAIIVGIIVIRVT